MPFLTEGSQEKGGISGGSEPKPFNILSLDGGGTWALIQVMALIDLFTTTSVKGEDIRGWDVLKHYDLIAANSGGSIVLGGLLENMSLGEIRNRFLDEEFRWKIFANTNLCRSQTRSIARKFCLDIGPKYDTDKKLDALEELLDGIGNIPVSNFGSHEIIKKRNHGKLKSKNGRDIHFVILGFDYDLNREVFFRSDPISLAGGRGISAPVTLAEAIHASTNAPVNYFDAPAEIEPHRYWDGAIGGYNNPVLAAVIEAVANVAPYIIPTISGKHIPCSKIPDIRVLSLGTGNKVLLPFQSGSIIKSIFIQQKTKSCFPNDLKKLAESILDDPPDAATFHAYMLLGEPLPPNPITNIRLIRMNPLIQPVQDNGSWKLPKNISSNQFKRLCDMSMDAIGDGEIQLIRTFAQAWIGNFVPNQPVRANRITLDPEIGHPFYSDALTQARSLGLVP